MRISRVSVLGFGLTAMSLAGGVNAAPSATPAAGAVSVGLAATKQPAMQKAVFFYFTSRYDEALAAIKEAEDENGVTTETINLKAAIAARQRQFDKAKELYNQALAKSPDNVDVRLNLAELELQQGNYAEARRMFSVVPVSGAKAEFLEYQIILSYILEGNMGEADRLIDQIKFPSNTAAYYFAHAAREFKANNRPEATKWIAEAQRIFGARIEIALFDSFIIQGWFDPTKPAQEPTSGPGLLAPESTPVPTLSGSGN